MRNFLLILLAFADCLFLAGQQRMGLTMERAIALAQEQSLDAMVAKTTYLGNYWSFRSFKAELLPSLNVSSTVMNYDRSQRALQDPNTGEIRYRLNDNLTNKATLSIDQNIAATGGSLSFSTSLSRLDQYSPLRDITYYTQPLTLSYLQPLWSYNSLKWDKQIEPQKYERAKRNYIESMEDVTIKTVRLFYNLLLSRISYEIALVNYDNMKTMYGIASRRFGETGTVTQSELLQLELRMINDSLSISTQDKQYQAKMMEFRFFLRLNDQVELDPIPPSGVPDMILDYETVLDKVLTHSPFLISQSITSLEAERLVSQAKANRGISVLFNTNFGLSNNDERFSSAYSNLMNYQMVGLTLRVPIMDWGMGRGRVQVAEAQRQTTLYQLEQELEEYVQGIYLNILEFNTQRDQLRMARYADEIARQRYELTLQNFAAGSISVTELNTAQSEKDAAHVKYISEMQNYWLYYFQIRKMSAFDYITQQDISAEFDRLIK